MAEKQNDKRLDMRKITMAVNPGKSGQKLSRKEKKILLKPSTRNLPMKSCSGKRYSFYFSINGTG